MIIKMLEYGSPFDRFEVENPTWELVEEKLHAMDGRTSDGVFLWGDDGYFMGISGGASNGEAKLQKTDHGHFWTFSGGNPHRYFVQGHTKEIDGFCCASGEEGGPPQRVMCAGDSFETESKYVIGIEEVIMAAKAFFLRGELAKELKWECSPTKRSASSEIPAGEDTTCDVPLAAATGCHPLENCTQGDSMASEDFPSLVKTARQKTNETCEKSKLILRKLLPDMEELQKENTQFSPRLMALMLARSGEKLAPEDRASFEAALQYAEQFQYSLTAWMVGLRKMPPNLATSKDREQCTQAIDILAGHADKLDRILAKIGVSPSQ